MAETGWPLIPREVLPPPVPPAGRVRRPQRVTQADAGRQLSIFSAETTEPSLTDLAGLLAGPGRLHRMGGTARVSVRVDAAWRVHALVAELVSRGLVVNWRPLQTRDDQVRRDDSPPIPGADAHTGGDAVNPVQTEGPAATDPAPAEQEAPTPPAPRFEVRTAYSSRLHGLAHAWPVAADELFLSGSRLRLWVAAAGRPHDGGYALGLDPLGDVPWDAVDAALRRAGLAGAVSDHGLDYLVTGRKRLARLAELVGDRPHVAPAALWPGGAVA